MLAATHWELPRSLWGGCPPRSGKIRSLGLNYRIFLLLCNSDTMHSPENVLHRGSNASVFCTMYKRAQSKTDINFLISKWFAFQHIEAKSSLIANPGVSYK